MTNSTFRSNVTVRSTLDGWVADGPYGITMRADHDRVVTYCNLVDGCEQYAIMHEKICARANRK